MTIYSIGDLHLSDGNKPMDVFGDNWSGHVGKIQSDWQSRVKDDDVVLLPGDLSWAMQLEEAIPHIELVGSLPGRKVIIKGNHDYWWNSVGRLRSHLPKGMYAIQNDCLTIDGVLFAGSRGWTLPGADADSSDRKIYDRELIRLEMSLKAARAISTEYPLVCMSHYPPVTYQNTDTPVAGLLQRYNVDFSVYGHLHGMSLSGAFNGLYNGVTYKCVSCDGLDFKLASVLTV